MWRSAPAAGCRLGGPKITALAPTPALHGTSKSPGFHAEPGCSASTFCGASSLHPALNVCRSWHSRNFRVAPLSFSRQAKISVTRGLLSQLGKISQLKAAQFRRATSENNSEYQTVLTYRQLVVVSAKVFPELRAGTWEVVGSEVRGSGE